MGLIYGVAISLVGLLLLTVVLDAVTSVSRRQGWPDIRMGMSAQHAQPGIGAERATDLPIKGLREAAAHGQWVARNDEVAEAA